MAKITKCTLIEKLINDGWFDSENEAFPWAMDRKILVNDKPVLSLKEKIPADSVIRVKEYYKKQYSGKGGIKLEHALSVFNAGSFINGKTALDCGSCTGGFTDCLLKNGASKVYAVDAGFGQLSGKLLQHERVVNMERTNLSDEILKNLFPKPEFISLDLSYLSLRKAIPVCFDILHESGRIVSLIKPIYEIDDSSVRRSGDMYESEILNETLNSLCEFFIDFGFDILGFTYRPVRGNNGAVEYFVYLSCGEAFGEIPNINEAYKEFVKDAVKISFDLDKFKKS